MMAIVDVYDALRSERPYKKAFSHEEAISIMHTMSGSHFDAALFACFTNIQDAVQTISNTLKDA